MCDSIWFRPEIIEEVAKKLLPKEYTLRPAPYETYETSRFEVHHKRGGEEYTVAAFSLSPFRGCECAAIISHGAWVDAKYRNKGLGTILLRIRTEAIKQVGYGVAFATVRSDNLAERKLLLKAGWGALAAFQPEHSDSRTELWMLRPESEKEER